MVRLPRWIGGVAVLLSIQPVMAADLHAPVRARGFLASCEDLGRFCFADACGADQIEAALNCRARCPSAAVMSVVPAACRVPGAPPVVTLRRRG
jgi:hypothetical protein